MNRIVIQAPLTTIFGTAQPTLFPQVGHAVYQDPKTNEDCLVVESVQSVANRLEILLLKLCSDRFELIDIFKGLPYVQVEDKATKKILGSSLTIPHRLGSGYLAKHKESKLGEILKIEIAEKGLYKTVFKYDPNSIIHGVFFSHLDDGGVNKIPRFLTGRIEAKNVVAVPVGGASKDPFSPSGKWDMSYFNNATKGSSVGLGNLPYHSEEYACQEITATFSIDKNLVLATGLPQPAQDLLLAIAEWKVLKFLTESIRLRTTEYECGEILRTENKLSDLEKFNEQDRLKELEEVIPTLIQKCREQGFFAAPAVTKVSITLKEKKDKSSSNQESVKETSKASPNPKKRGK